MVVDVLGEETLTLAEAAEVLPRLRRGRKVHVSTLYRWVSRGVGGVRLEAVKLGRTLITSREALQRFAERRGVADGVLEVASVPLSRSAVQAEREAERRGL
ncbi:MAG: helix-turn-helix domain-containing protein [Planctomycetota bacterium]